MSRASAISICSSGEWPRRLAPTPTPAFTRGSWISAAFAWLVERPCDAERHDGDGRSSGLLHLGFALGSADAVDELSGAIAAAGYRVLEPPHRVGQLGPYQSVVLDPDGNQVKLTV